MKLSIKDFFGKSDQYLSFLRIWSHLRWSYEEILNGKLNFLCSIGLTIQTSNQCKKDENYNIQKQPLEAFCKKRCSQKFSTVHRKTPGSEHLF